MSFAQSIAKSLICIQVVAVTILSLSLLPHQAQARRVCWDTFSWNDDNNDPRDGHSFDSHEECHGLSTGQIVGIVLGSVGRLTSLTRNLWSRLHSIDSIAHDFDWLIDFLFTQTAALVLILSALTCLCCRRRRPPNSQATARSTGLPCFKRKKGSPRKPAFQPIGTSTANAPTAAESQTPMTTAQVWRTFEAKPTTRLNHDLTMLYDPIPRPGLEDETLECPVSLHKQNHHLARYISWHHTRQYVKWVFFFLFLPLFSSFFLLLFMLVRTDMRTIPNIPVIIVLFCLFFSSRNARVVYVYEDWGKGFILSSEWFTNDQSDHSIVFISDVWAFFFFFLWASGHVFERSECLVMNHCRVSGKSESDCVCVCVWCRGVLRWWYWWIPNMLFEIYWVSTFVLVHTSSLDRSRLRCWIMVMTVPIHWRMTRPRCETKVDGCGSIKPSLRCSRIVDSLPHVFHLQSISHLASAIVAIKHHKRYGGEQGKRWAELQLAELMTRLMGSASTSA